MQHFSKARPLQCNMTEHIYLDCTHTYTTVTALIQIMELDGIVDYQVFSLV